VTTGRRPRHCFIFLLFTFSFCFTHGSAWAQGRESVGQPEMNSPIRVQAVLAASATDDKRDLPVPSGSRNIPPSGLQPSETAPPVPSDMANSIRSVRLPRDVKLIALTFDLCEVESKPSGYDADIVNYLRSNRIKATFFAGGKWMRSHPDRTKEIMADPLFEIGNHSWNHKNFRKLGKEEALNQVLWTQAQYELLWEELPKRARFDAGEGAKEIPKAPGLFRFPYGACNHDMLKLIQDLGLLAIQWDVVSGDPAKGRSAAAIARTVISKAKSGSIIVFHANGRGHGTAESLAMFVPRLKEAGFGFATVSEMLASGTPVSAPECYETRPGDTLRYDSR
jgi:peptidoglycan-N-acetylglucosamine deacetylase